MAHIAWMMANFCSEKVTIHKISRKYFGAFVEVVFPPGFVSQVKELRVIWNMLYVEMKTRTTSMLYIFVLELNRFGELRNCGTLLKKLQVRMDMANIVFRLLQCIQHSQVE